VLLARLLFSSRRVGASGRGSGGRVCFLVATAVTLSLPISPPASVIITVATAAAALAAAATPTAIVVPIPVVAAAAVVVAVTVRSGRRRAVARTGAGPVVAPTPATVPRAQVKGVVRALRVEAHTVACMLRRQEGT
jgi:hypothetical protein